MTKVVRYMKSLPYIKDGDLGEIRNWQSHNRIQSMEWRLMPLRLLHCDRTGWIGERYQHPFESYYGWGGRNDVSMQVQIGCLDCSFHFVDDGRLPDIHLFTPNGPPKKHQRLPGWILDDKGEGDKRDPRNQNLKDGWDVQLQLPNISMAEMCIHNIHGWFSATSWYGGCHRMHQMYH